MQTRAVHHPHVNCWPAQALCIVTGVYLAGCYKCQLHTAVSELLPTADSAEHVDAVARGFYARQLLSYISQRSAKRILKKFPAQESISTLHIILSEKQTNKKTRFANIVKWMCISKQDHFDKVLCRKTHSLCLALLYFLSHFCFNHFLKNKIVPVVYLYVAMVCITL